MKVIETEEPKTGGPGHTPQVWEGQRVVCPNTCCRKLLELEPGDSVRILVLPKITGGPAQIAFTCPVCHQVGTEMITPLVGVPYTREAK